MDGTRERARQPRKQSKTSPLIGRFSRPALAGALLIVAAGFLPSAQAAGAGQQVATAGPAVVDETPTPTPRGDGVAAIVNDTVISQFDLRQRMALFLATSGVRPNAQQEKKIREQVLKQLETERLQLLEAQKAKITVSSAEVDRAISSILQDNHLTMDHLTQMLSQAGVYMATFREQIAAQIAWSKTVQARYAGDVHVSQSDIDSELARLRADADKPRYRVSEIFQAVDTPEQDTKVDADMNELETQLRMGAPFEAVARQFSQNPSAAEGGDLGWIQAGQLQPALDAVLTKMNSGDISEPVRAAGGYYILKLQAREVPAGTKLPEQPKDQYPPGVLPLARVLLPIGPKPPKELLDQAMRAANMIRSNIQGCTNLQQLVGQMRGAVYMNLGTMHLSDLSQQMQQSLANTKGGGVTEPFHSEAGVELIVRCDAAAPAVTTYKIPSREEIEQQLFEEQMTVLARRYMRDLRRDADIETR